MRPYMDARKTRRPKSIHDPAYRELCAILRQLREVKGLTQRELAEIMNEHRSFVWKSEAGERRLDAVELVRWCLACDADPDEVFAQIRKKVKTSRRRV
jgi:transcriptional regulator with XRE-family HTH domain